MIMAKTAKQPPKNMMRRRLPKGVFKTGGSVLGCCLNGRMCFIRS